MNKPTYRKVQIEGEKVEERGRGGEKMRHGDGRKQEAEWGKERKGKEIVVDWRGVSE